MQRREFIVKGMLSAIMIAGRALYSPAQAAESGDIVLGQSAPLSGSFSELGKAYRDGALLYFDKVNRAGGVHARRIRLDTLDDGYVPKRAEDNTRQLIKKHKALALFGHMFTNTVKASLPIATAAQVPYIAPYTGISELYSEFNPMLFMTRASFAAELDALLKHVKAMGLQRVALIRYDSPQGIELEKELDSKMRAMHLTPVAIASMKLNSRDPAQAAAALAPARPAAVLLGVSGGDAVAFIRQFNQVATAKPIQYLARSLVAGHQLVAELGEESRGIVMSQLVPSPFNGKTRIAREYQAALKDAAPVGIKLLASHVGFEGFIAGKIATEALRRAGSNPTRNAFTTALESLHDWDCGDFTIDFSPTGHAGSKFVTVTVIGAGGHFIE